MKAVAAFVRKNEYQPLSWVVINGDGECSTIAASLGRFVVQADWPGPIMLAVTRRSAAFIRWTRLFLI